LKAAVLRIAGSVGITDGVGAREADMESMGVATGGGDLQLMATWAFPLTLLLRTMEMLKPVRTASSCLCIKNIPELFLP